MRIPAETTGVARTPLPSATLAVALALLVAGALPAGCIKSETTPCGNFVCSKGKHCDSVHQICVDQEQLTLCEGQPDGTACTFRDQPGYKCDQGVCIRVGECGDGVVDLREQCDLGAANSDLPNGRCRSDCTTQRCGDGIADTDAGETCDGSDFRGKTCVDRGFANTAGLTCLTNCVIDDSGCQAVCGNGLAEPGEECDDGAQNSDTAPGACRTTCKRFTCGDGVQDPGEACDDGNNIDDKQCAADCNNLCGDGVLNPNLGEECDRAQDNGVSPSDCLSDCTLTTCGDGHPGGNEGCDDGANADGDGCSATCQVEPRWSCAYDSGQGRSVCSCAGYSYGADCSQCVVFVAHDSTAPNPDGRTWATAFPRVQQGIDAAADAEPGCQVWVKQGTYRVFRATLLDTIRVRDDVSVYGGFQGGEAVLTDRDPVQYPTILDGNQSAGGGVKVLHVVTAVATIGAVLDGLVIRGGEASGAGDDAVGGGLYAYGASVTLVGVTIQSNQSAQSGAGIYAYASALTLVDGMIRDNAAGPGVGPAGGGIYLEYGNLSMTGTRVLNNTASSGGGLALGPRGAADIWNAAFANNDGGGQGGGLSADRDSDVVATGTIFSANTANNGGGAVVLGRGYFRRCVFAGNRATTGGGLLAYSPSLVVDSGFHANHALSGGGLATTGTVRRSIFAGNSARWGGGIVSGNQGLLETVAVIGNSALRGGGWHTFDPRSTTWPGAFDYFDPVPGPLAALGSTFAGNRAAIGGGISGGIGDMWGASILELTGCLLWGNSAQTAPYAAVHPGTVPPILRHCLADAPWTAQPTNTSADPLFVTPPAGGNLTSAIHDPATFQTTLAHTGAGWTPGALAGRFISLGTQGAPWYYVVSNTADALTVWSDVTGRAGSGTPYFFFDPRLSGSSPAIDAGSSPPLGPSDVDGRARAVDGPAADTGYGTPPADIGAYEYQVGGAPEVCDVAGDEDGDGLADCADPDCADHASCLGVVERDCTGGADDDNDGVTDCADPDCAGDPNCVGETSCIDNVDNGGDPRVDCDDPECDGRAGCGIAYESDCTNGIDDDGDGFIDCADIRCLGRDGCRFWSEGSGSGVGGPECSDGIDNDGNGDTDCADIDCWNDPACTRTEDCTDGIDNDDNGFTDCADAKCIAHPSCNFGPESDCGDGTDNDGDGAIDCLDKDCVDAPPCKSGGESGATCTDAMDNDGDGLTDCDDPDCWIDAACPTAATERRCLQSFDADNDGLTYCEDPDCVTWSECTTMNEDCHDSKDNNGNLLIDCADPTCAHRGWGELCHTREICPAEYSSGPFAPGFQIRDEDGNGATDCADPACAGIYPCESDTEKSCQDLIDNDGDGLTDCNDPDCQSILSTECDLYGAGYKEVCNDVTDNDGDGLADCADPDCFGDPLCQ